MPVGRPVDETSSVVTCHFEMQREGAPKKILRRSVSILTVISSSRMTTGCSSSSTNLHHRVVGREERGQDCLKKYLFYSSSANVVVLRDWHGACAAERSGASRVKDYVQYTALVVFK